ncbi:MAG TPA: hypothetical protein VNH65_07955 [Candidatus Acidoferrum sp.]|nr:hypothetical protein [Candidatus Acidoferrum sp.]
MKQNNENDSVQVFLKATYYNSFLIEAIFELLAEKNVLTGEEVLARVKKLRDEGPSNSYWLH